MSGVFPGFYAVGVGPSYDIGKFPEGVPVFLDYFPTVGFVSQFYFLLCRFPVCGDPASRASSLFQLQEICHVPYASIPHREAKHSTFLQSLSPLPLNLFSDGLPELHQHYHHPGTTSHGVPTAPFSTPPSRPSQRFGVLRPGIWHPRRHARSPRAQNPRVLPAASSAVNAERHRRQPVRMVEKIPASYVAFGPSLSAECLGFRDSRMPSILTVCDV